MPKYRLLALDLDGTLLNSKKEISKESIKWIKFAYSKGVRVVFATGRGMPRIEHLLEEIDLDISMVLLNGAEVRNDKNNILARKFISSEDVKELYSLAVKTGSPFWGYNTEEQITWKKWTNDMFEYKWLKFGMKHQDLNVIKELKNQITKLKDIEMTSSASNNIECSLKGFTKEVGIQTLCNQYNIEMNNVMSIGDNLNDLGLIKQSGLGIAMGNADENLKLISDKITETNDDNGVAYAIERYLFN